MYVCNIRMYFKLQILALHNMKHQVIEKEKKGMMQ